MFLGSMWRDFLRFYHLRVRKPFFDFAQVTRQLSAHVCPRATQPSPHPFVSQEKKQSGIGKLREPLGDISLALPRSRSNVWPRSWKRFLIDFMYGRGYVMLYPNLNDQRAFSTTYMEHGDHTAKDGKRRSPYSRKPNPNPTPPSLFGTGLKEKVEAHTVRKDVDPLKTVPLVSRDEISDLVNLLSTLPSAAELPVFDLHHRRRSLDLLFSQVRSADFDRLPPPSLTFSPASGVSLRASPSPRTCAGGASG